MYMILLHVIILLIKKQKFLSFHIRAIESFENKILHVFIVPIKTDLLFDVHEDDKE